MTMDMILTGVIGFILGTWFGLILAALLDAKEGIMWIVTCDYVHGVLTYFVENTETGERRGQFDCEPWAQEFANELNKQ